MRVRRDCVRRGTETFEKQSKRSSVTQDAVLSLMRGEMELSGKAMSRRGD